MEGAEASLRNEFDQLHATALREFPILNTRLPTPAEMEQLKIQNPAKFQRFVQLDAAMLDRGRKAIAMEQQRAVQAQQLAAQEAAQQEQRAAERQRMRAEQDQYFERLAAQHINGWERIRGDVKAQARRTLQAAGLSNEEIEHLGSGDHDGIDPHSAVLQLVLAKAAQWDLAQERVRQARQAPVPPVIRPGTYRPRDNGEQSVRGLEVALKNAKGQREQVRLGAELVAAQRRLNGG
jgi:hypothetical protein